jgi:hypothetical protein
MPKDSPIAISRKEKGFTDDGGRSDRSVFEVLYTSLEQGTDAESQCWYQLIKNYTLLNITKMKTVFQRSPESQAPSSRTRTTCLAYAKIT